MAAETAAFLFKECIMIENIQIEICTGSYTDVCTAESFDAVDRIELNSALELGGLTPSLHTFLKAREKTDKKIICMVRTRPAGFIYTEDELEIMYQDAETFLREGADGIVFGFLNKDRTVNVPAAEKFCSLIHSYGKTAVFHKAFDLTADQDAAAASLIGIGIDRILTSGGRENVTAGRDAIAHLQKNFGSRIQILPGGGVSESTLIPLLKHTGCTQFHMSARSTYQDDGPYDAVDPNKIRRTLLTLRSALNENRRQLTREDDAMIKNDTYEH